ncbi:MAG: hypothetical protein M3299_16890, partial [Thermoproteota archaeon]|nr:hypothetical protein [Thermoproteota archaeon]
SIGGVSISLVGMSVFHFQIEQCLSSLHCQLISIVALMSDPQHNWDYDNNKKMMIKIEVRYLMVNWQSNIPSFGIALEMDEKENKTTAACSAE